MSNYAISYIFKVMDKFSPAIKEMHKTLDEFQEGIEKVEKKMNKANHSMKGFAESMGHVGRKMSMYVTAPLIAMGGYALKNASEFKMMQLSLEAFTGTAASASAVLEDIKKQSMKVPISVGDLTKAATMLLQTGTSKADVSKRLNQMSVMALATGQDIVQLTKRISRFHALGSASPVGFARFMPALVQQLRQMATQAGLSKKKIDELLGGGKKMSWDILQNAMDKLTVKGGAFFEVAEAKSNVWEATLQEIHNEIQIMAADLGDVILQFFGIDGSAMSLRDKMAAVTGIFHDFLKSHEKLIGISLAIAAIGAALGPVLMSLSSILTIVSLIGWPITLIIVAVGLIAYAAYKAYKAFQDLYNSSAEFKQKIDMVVAGVKYLWELLKKVVAAFDALAHPFTARINLEVDKSQVQSQLQGLTTTLMAPPTGGQLSFSPLTHAIHSTIDMNIKAPPGVVQNVKSSGGNAIKADLGINNAWARGYGHV